MTPLLRQTALAFAWSRPTMPALMTLGMFWGAFAAQVPDLKAQIGASDGAFGLVLLCAAVGALLAMGVAPRFDTRAGAIALPLAAVLLAAAFQGLGMAPGLIVFAMAIALCGSASGLLDVTTSGRIASLEARHRTTLMSLNHAFFSFSYAASALATGFAREAGVPPPAVFGMAGVVALLLALCMRMEPEAAPPGSTPAPARGSGFTRIVVGVGIVAIAAFLAESATEAWSALHIERTLDGRATQGALGPALLGLTMGFGRVAGHFLTRQRREEAVITLAALVSAAGSGLAALAPSPAVAYAGFAILGFGISILAPIVFALVGRLAGPGARARAIGRVAMIGYTAFLFGPPTMGFLSEALGLRAVFGVLATIMALSPLALLLLRGRSTA